ncbi:MAG: hypothetical protein JKY03_01625 [Aureispira sp.]|nr:hypothetical protein [Aureispira sp.]
MRYPQKKTQYRLSIKELRLKQPISTTLTHFYNPLAIIILVTVVRNSISNEFAVVPQSFNSDSKYITFIEKNNERILKKISIDFFFKERLQNDFEIFFFLVEISPIKLTFSEVLEQLHFILNSPASKNLTEELLVKKINSFFKNITYNNLFLLKAKTPISSKPLNIITSNSLTSLDATIEPLS